MNDVATYSRRKLFFIAMLQLAFGLAALATALLVVPWFVRTEVVDKEGGSWFFLIIGIMPLGIGWAAFSGGVRRLRASFEKECWFRAGNKGVSVRIPGEARMSSAWLSYDMRELSFSRDQVIGAVPFEYSVNGIPTGSSVYIQTTNGDYEVDGRYFWESSDDICAAVCRERGQS